MHQRKALTGLEQFVRRTSDTSFSQQKARADRNDCYDGRYALVDSGTLDIAADGESSLPLQVPSTCFFPRLVDFATARQ